MQTHKHTKKFRHNPKTIKRYNQTGGNIVNMLTIKAFAKKFKIDKIYILLNELYTENNSPLDFFEYSYNIPDTAFNKILENPFKWYTENVLADGINLTNVSMLSLYHLKPNLKLDNFKVIVLQIARNLFRLCLTMKFPEVSEGVMSSSMKTDNNVSNIHSQNLLNFKCNNNADAIKTVNLAIFILTHIYNYIFKYEYKYEKLFLIVRSYILFFTEGSNGFDCNYISNSKGSCFNILRIINQNIMPSIILPSFIQIDFYNALDVWRAPIIHFRLLNTRTIVNGKVIHPCAKVINDVLFHNKYNIKPRIYISEKRLTTNKIDLRQFVDRNAMFGSISHLYRFKRLPTGEILNDTENIKKYINCCILFIMMYEFIDGGFRYFKHTNYLFYKETATIYVNLQQMYFKMLSKLTTDELNSFGEAMNLFTINQSPDITNAIAKLHTIDGFKKALDLLSTEIDSIARNH